MLDGDDEDNNNTSVGASATAAVVSVTTTTTGSTVAASTVNTSVGIQESNTHPHPTMTVENEVDVAAPRENLHSLVTALVVEKNLITCPLLHAHDDEDEDIAAPQRSVGAKWIQQFFTEDFLSLVIWKGLCQTQSQSTLTSTTIGTSSELDLLPPGCGKWEDWPLRVVHHINEASRTASFVLIDRNTNASVVVDPPYHYNNSTSSNAMMSTAKPTAVVLTHVPVTHRSGVLLRNQSEWRRLSAALVGRYGSPTTTTTAVHLQRAEEGEGKAVPRSWRKNCCKLRWPLHASALRSESQRRLLAIHRVAPTSDFVLLLLPRPVPPRSV